MFDERLTPPVIFVANHSSHLDTPTILRAIPRKWRNRTAVAAAADYFYKKRWTANGVALLFNTVPLGRNGGGLDNGATDHVDRLIGERWNLLMFPEGTRSRDGEIGKVRSGAAVIAARHGIDIVPIYVSGTHDAMPPGQNWPQAQARADPLAPAQGRGPLRRADRAARRVAAARGDGRGAGLLGAQGPAPSRAGAAPVEHDVLLIHKTLLAHEAMLAAQPSPRFDPAHAARRRSTRADRSTPAA